MAERFEVIGSLCCSPQMVTNNLRYYDTLLQSGRPLFTVEALLSPPEIILHPHTNELFKLMTQAMLEVVEGYVVVCSSDVSCKPSTNMHIHTCRKMQLFLCC